MKTKVLNSLFAIILFIGVTFFVTSCGEEVNNNNQPIVDKSVTSVDVNVLDNSFSISSDNFAFITYEENKILNLNKENFDVTVNYSNGTKAEHYTDYQLESDVPNPIAVGNYHINISIDSAVVAQINFEVQPKMVSGFDQIQNQGTLTTHYTGEDINAIDLFNAQYNNFLEENKDYYTISSDSVTQASAIGNYGITLNAKDNYAFEGIGTASVNLYWTIVKREIVVTLDSKTFMFSPSLQNVSDDPEKPEYTISANAVGPEMTYYFKDDLENPIDSTLVESLFTYLNALKTTSINPEAIQVKIKDEYADNYTFADNDYGYSTSGDILNIRYEVTPYLLDRPTIQNGNNHHYTFDYNHIYVEPLYNGKTVTEYEQDGEDLPLEYYLFDYSCNYGFDAVNANSMPYHASFTFNGETDFSYNFRFKDAPDDNLSLSFEYDFYIDKKPFTNDYQLNDFYTVGDILDEDDTENYIGANITIEVIYQDNLDISYINARNHANFNLNPYYTSASKAFFYNHGLLNEDSYIDFDTSIYEQYAQTTLEAGTYNITLIYVHSYNPDSIELSYEADWANFEAITFPAKLVIKPAEININSSNTFWLINYDNEEKYLDAVYDNLTYNGLSHTVTAEINADYISLSGDYTYYYNTEYAGTYNYISEIKKAGYYYAKINIKSTNKNYTTSMNAITSRKFHIKPQDVTINVSFSGTAESGWQNDTYFSYYTGENKTIDYCIGINFDVDNTVIITASNLNENNQKVITSLNNISLVYEYSNDGGENYSELVGDNIDLSQIGYYKLTLTYNYDNINYNIGSSLTTVVEEWQIIDTTIDVSAVDWTLETDFEYTGTDDYPLLENLPLGVFASIYYAYYDADLDILKTSSNGTPQIGENYAYINNFYALSNIDGALDNNNNPRITFTGKDASFFGTDFAYNSSYEEDPDNEEKYTYTKGKFFNITKIHIQLSDMQWSYTADGETIYVSGTEAGVEIDKSVESVAESLVFAMNYNSEINNNIFSIVYEYQTEDMPDPEEVEGNAIYVPLTVGEYTLKATVTINANYTDTFAFYDGTDTIEITLDVSITDNEGTND